MANNKYDFYSLSLKDTTDLTMPNVDADTTVSAKKHLVDILLKTFEYQDKDDKKQRSYYSENGVEHDDILLMPLRCNKKVAKYSGEVNVMQKNDNGDTVTMQPKFESSHPYCFVIFDLRDDVPIVAIQRSVLFGVYPDKVVDILTAVLNKKLIKWGLSIAFEPMKIDGDFWEDVKDRINEGDKLKEIVFDFEEASIDERLLDCMTEEVKLLVTAMKQFGQKKLVMRFTAKEQQNLLKREKDFLSMLQLCYLSDNEYKLVARFSSSSICRTGDKVRLRLVLKDDVCDEFMNNKKTLDDKCRLALWLDKAREVCCVKDLQMIRFSDEDCRLIRETYKDSYVLKMMQELTSYFIVDLKNIKPKPEEFFILVFAVFDRIKRNDNIDDSYGIRIWGMLRNAIASATQRAWGRDADKAERETMAGIVYATVMDCIELADIIKYYEQKDMLWRNFCEYQKYIDITEVNIYQGYLEKFFNHNKPLKSYVIGELRHYLDDPTTFYTREDGMPMRVEVKGAYKREADPHNQINFYIHGNRDLQEAIDYIEEELRKSVDPETQQVMNTPLAKVIARMIEEKYLNEKVPFNKLKAQFGDLISGTASSYNKAYATLLFNKKH